MLIFLSLISEEFMPLEKIEFIYHSAKVYITLLQLAGEFSSNI